MTDTRVQKYARILVDYSAKVQPGERVGIVTSMAAEPVIRELFALILERGAYPHLIIDFPDQDEIYYAHVRDEGLDYINPFHRLAFEEFEVLLKIRADTNTRAIARVPSAKIGQRQKALSRLLQAQMQRGASGALRWMSTIFPTQAYAMDADMGLEEYQNFFYRACHADDATPDPVAHWEGIRKQQDRFIERIQGHDQVEISGPNASLKLSVKNRTFINACGLNNMPDGEIYTGPVEDSVNGWVRYTYPAIYAGKMVEGVELTFEQGKVVKATADKNEEFLLQMLNSDPGARYLGEFAIGTNYEIDRFTRSILFDEKIGGSFHTAVGAGYPETGNTNKSQVHWDLICDIRQDSEIRLDGEVIYRNGQFVF